MRYCPYCHRWNTGRPPRCCYCGRTWHVRLCPRGHENPPDAQFCGSCGSADLTETAGSRPLWFRLMRIGILVVLVVLVATLARSRFRLTEQNVAYMLAMGLILVGLFLALSLLPSPLRRPLLLFINKAKSTAMRGLRWCWERLKLMLT